MHETIGIIGYGNMGSAIAEQLKKDYQICVFDKDELKTRGLKGAINGVLETALVVQNSGIIILAVKPQDFETLLALIKNSAAGPDKLYISIAAGITTGYIEKYLGIARVIRVMPNILLKAGMAITCLSKGKFATERDLEFTENLFTYMGETLAIKEELINAATAVSGSGPAYVCHYIETGLIDANNVSEEKKAVFLGDFKKAAKDVGFSEEEAYFLVSNTFNGTINFLKKTKISAQELRKQVTSKGGTTEAALGILQNGGSLGVAVKAALKRAEELSKKE